MRAARAYRVCRAGPGTSVAHMHRAQRRSCADQFVQHLVQRGPRTPGPRVQTPASPHAGCPARADTGNADSHRRGGAAVSIRSGRLAAARARQTGDAPRTRSRATRPRRSRGPASSSAEPAGGERAPDVGELPVTGCERGSPQLRGWRAGRRARRGQHQQAPRPSGADTVVVRVASGACAQDQVGVGALMPNDGHPGRRGRPSPATALPRSAATPRRRPSPRAATARPRAACAAAPRAASPAPS
jgi:hypothetical protein